MGFFSKKGKAPQVSPLSEAEIHKKLYGEFETGTGRTILGEREHAKDPAGALPSAAETGTAHDLFTAHGNPLHEAAAPKKSVVPEVKSPENASRYVPFHEFEKKATTSSAPVDAYARFRSNKNGEKGPGVAAKIGTALWEVARDFFAALMDPKNVMLRRVFYWSTALVVVFLLFWGVNVLNSQRETAMNSQYKGRAEEPAVVEAPSPAPEAPKAVERPVVITPVPQRPQREVIITPAAAVKPRATGASSATPYAIQVVTYPSQTDAEQVMETLKRDRLNAFVKEYQRASGRVFYVVFIGGFRTEAEAEAQLVKFRAKEVARPFQDAFVKKL